MKKIVLLFVLVAMSWVTYAQPRAVGLRFGYGIEASYEHLVLPHNMVSVEVGWLAMQQFEAAASFDWINPGGVDFSQVWHDKGTWNWYVGAGLQGGFMLPTSYMPDASTKRSMIATTVGVLARVGVEYNFWFPLQISIEYRPVCGPSFLTTTDVIQTPEFTTRITNTDVYFDSFSLYAYAFALSVRYAF